MPLWMNYLAQFLVAIVATISFGVTFRVSPRHYLACGLTGAVGWLVYLLCTGLGGLSAPVATLVAALPLTACARMFAIRHKAPITLFCCAASSRWFPAPVSTIPPTIFCGMTVLSLPTRAWRPSRSLWPWRWALRWSAVFL